jgi:hypothetical protein
MISRIGQMRSQQRLSDSQLRSVSEACHQCDVDETEVELDHQIEMI